MQKIIAIFLTLTLSLILNSYAKNSYANTIKEISLLEAQEQAKAQSFDVKKEDLNFHKVILARKGVIGSILPQIGASSTYSNFLKKPVIQGFSFNSKHELEMGLSLRQRVFEFGALGSSMEAASSLLQESQFRKEQVSNYVAYEATLAYYAVLLAHWQLNIAENSYKNARKNLEILNQSFSGGRPPKGDILRLQTDIVARESQVNLSQANLISAEIMLKEILKIPENTPIKLTTSFKTKLPEIDKDVITQKTLHQNLELKVLGERVNYLSKVAQVTKAQGLPKIGFFYNFGRGHRSDNKILAADQKINTQIIGLELTWNLWDGGQTKIRHQEALTDTRIVDYEVKKTTDKLLKDLSQAINNYMAIRANLATDEKSLELAERSFKLTQNLLRTGKTSITELNSTEGLMNSVKLNYASNLFRANESLSFIHYLMNHHGI